MSKTDDYIDDITQYIERLLSETVAIRQLDDSIASTLPANITSSYEPYSLELFGKEILLLCDTDETSYTPAQVQKQQELIEKKTERIVVFVFWNIVSYNIQRLIAQRVNFMIPHKQMFIPDILIDLKPLKGDSKKVAERIPPIAQCLVLYHLQIASLNGKVAQDMEKLFKVSYPNINRALRWLSEKQYITLTGGKTKSISFNADREKLWIAIEPALIDPIDRIMYTDEKIDNGCEAGINALSEYTMLNSENRDSYALSKDNFKKISVKTDKEYGLNRIEIWKYDPALLSKSGIVDKLSLYLTLRKNDDERIQIELENMIKNMIW